MQGARIIQYAQPRKTLKSQVQELEANLIKDALRRNRWNRGATARELGLSRVGLLNKLKRYGLNNGDWQ